MKNDKLKYLLCTLFFAVLAAITFRCCWGENMVFSASDINIGRLGYIKNYLPASLTGFFSGNQLLGVSAANFTLFKVMLSLFPAETFGNVFYGGFLVLGSSAMVWFLRLWNRSWIASIFGALVAFWFNSIMLAVSGHIFKIEVLVFSVLSLCLIEQSIRASGVRRCLGFSALGGLSVGIMLLEQQDVALLAGLFLGSYTMFRLIQEKGRDFMGWIAVLMPIGIIALLFAGGTMLDSYSRNIANAASVQGSSSERWDFVTQWSMVPEEWPDLIASGWSGWSSNNPEGPYWGRIGQSADWEETKQGFRNFKLTSVYFGIIPFLIGLFSLPYALRERKSKEGSVLLFWSIAGVIGLTLAFGKYSFLYRLFYELPLLGNIRAPIKLLDNFQICLGITSAFGLDALLRQSERKLGRIFWIVCLSVALLMLLAGIRYMVAPAGKLTSFAEMGFGPYAQTMVENMSKAWIHGGILAFVCASLVFFVWRNKTSAQWVGIVFVVVLAVDSLLLTSNYFKASDVSSLKQGNLLISYLKEHQGDDRSYFVDSGGIYNQWIASDGPYHGLNLFNIWQMPRMPVEYQTFLRTVGRNQVRAWELSAVRYIAAPAEVFNSLQKNPELGNQFEVVLNYQVPTAKGMRHDVLLEYSGAIPRFALFDRWNSIPVEKHCETLASAQHAPRTTLLVDSAVELPVGAGKGEFHEVSARVGQKSAWIDVNAESASILRFSQRFQPEWKVFVDGEPGDLLRVDYLCMGVLVPPGKHEVEFRCIDASAEVAFSSAVFLGALIASSILFWSASKGKQT